MSDNIFFESTDPVSSPPPSNYDQKCLCVLCLDTSYSMSGQPIEALKEGVDAFFKHNKLDTKARRRIETAIVKFDSNVSWVQNPPLLADEVDIEGVKSNLQLGGSTKLVDGVFEAMRFIEERKAYYREHGVNYYRPFIILMTDGEPDSGQDIMGLSTAIREGVSNKKFTFWAVGTEGYNKDVLSKICQPRTLAGLRYAEFFEWLSSTLTQVSNSKPDQRLLPQPTDAWELSDLSAG